MFTKVKSALIPLTLAASTLILVSSVLAQGYGLGRPDDKMAQATSPGQARSCQVRESAIKTRMTHLTALATDMMANFDKHAMRVEKYYTDKVIPSGKIVSNYDGLVSDIATKKAAVATALTKTQTDASGFSCSNGNPKAAMTTFRQDMQLVKKALKDYRTSIKNLIVAVRGVAK